MNEPGNAQVICTCGAVVADAQKHARFHALLAGVVRLLQDQIVIDPATGEPAPPGLTTDETTTIATADDLRSQARGAYATNTAYLAIATPTNAQVAAQVKALTQQNRVIIRLVGDMISAPTA